MSDLATRLLSLIRRPTYQPKKPKLLARSLDVPEAEMRSFRTLLRRLAQEGKLKFGRGHVVQPMEARDGLLGIFRRVGDKGAGIVRLKTPPGQGVTEVYVPPASVGDAAPGDTVLVAPGRGGQQGNRPSGRIIQVVERATRHFVGTFILRDGEARVRVDGTTFAEPIFLSPESEATARPEDKVVVELLRYPTPFQPGEGIVTEVLGRRGTPGVDTLSIIRAFELPDEFPPDVLAEAEAQERAFNEHDLTERVDFTQDLVITIDPVDAHDFDDALGLRFDARKRHWHLQVHIADVAWFVPTGGALDREARRRGTSVYLPQRVLPMFPELISNHLASLQAGRIRLTQAEFLELTEQGETVQPQFIRGGIRLHRRFSYEEAAEWLVASRGQPPELVDLLKRLDTFAATMHARRRRRGALELQMPEVELEYDEAGRLSGAHFRERNRAHVIVEECMLAANEAVADHLERQGYSFLRRNHAAPDPLKLENFLLFAKDLGFQVDRRQPTDRRQLQRLLDESADSPLRHAVHYALLRSLRQAEYSPATDGHYALATQQYTHFTSPIRRYPDLTIHRLLARKKPTKTARPGGDETELLALGEHCSFTERRADRAEQELVKLRLLNYLSERLGDRLEVIITGVEEFGFFAQAEKLPVEGLVHVRSLTDDFYQHDAETHSLIGSRHHRRFRLGDRVEVVVARVDLERRLLDFRVVGGATPAPPPPRRPLADHPGRSGRPARQAKRRGKK